MSPLGKGVVKREKILGRSSTKKKRHQNLEMKKTQQEFYSREEPRRGKRAELEVATFSGPRGRTKQVGCLNS